MPQQVLNSIENNFSKGLLTEYTGLNFPENAATASSNTIYTLVGDTVRREGFNYEANFTTNNIATVNTAVSSYKWNNASGDGETQFVVQQNGKNLSFFKSSNVSVASPLSTQRTATIDISGFAASGGTFDPTQECQYSDGNGYLFVFQATIDPIYIQYTAPSALVATVIPILIRDFVGTVDGLPINARPATLTDTHSYNLQNQGWTASNPWFATSSDVVAGPSTFGGSSVPTGPMTRTIQSGLTISNGQLVSITARSVTSGGVDQGSTALVATGTVTNYTGNFLTLNITSVYEPIAPFFYGLWTFTPISTGYLTTWNTAEGNYPSNADVWWYFKDSTGAFNPTTTAPNVTLATGNAPQGHYVFSAFNQNRAVASGLSSLPTVSTSTRPSTGCWFQGRVWYTGCDASAVGTSATTPYSWTETIYFSQTVTGPADFGTCYQTNDPTSENLFALLPTDGGTIQIQGCGGIFKLFPLMNALLVFAANGVWYISGGTSIGFTASDYSIVKLSAVRSISSYSYVDINGLPIFWNEEGIYQVMPAKQGQGLLNSPLHVNPLEVTPLSVGTIQTYFDNIPLQSKAYARGVYDPVNYIVQWTYRSTNETGIANRYVYDTILAYNTHNTAFYPYNFDTTTNGLPTINGIVYVQSPGGLNTPDSVIKYIVTNNAGVCTFAEENDPTFVDWRSAGISNNFISTFTTGYKLHGQATRRFQIPYLYVFSRTNGSPVSYSVQSIWDYAINTNSGRISNAQYATINDVNSSVGFRRHRLRGRGTTLQLQFNSINGQPFDFMGWAIYETANQGP